MCICVQMQKRRKRRRMSTLDERHVQSRNPNDVVVLSLFIPPSKIQISVSTVIPNSHVYSTIHSLTSLSPLSIKPPKPKPKPKPTLDSNASASLQIPHSSPPFVLQNPQRPHPNPRPNHHHRYIFRQLRRVSNPLLCGSISPWLNPICPFSLLPNPKT